MGSIRPKRKLDSLLQERNESSDNLISV